MMRAAVLCIVMLSGCAGGAGAPISYARDASAPRAIVSAPARPPNSEAPAPSDPQSEQTALSEYAIQPRDNDPLHPPRTYRVGRNEPLYDIATRFQIPMLALIEQNRLEPPYALAPGRVIELPPPNVVTVRRGDTLEQVARANNIDPRSLALLNRLTPPYQVREGDQLALPAMAGAWRENAPPAFPAEPPPVQAAPQPQAGAGRFSWPVRGVVLSRFGAQPGGRRLDGIEIAAPQGAPIGAAEAGDVVYAGDDLPGYGTLVLVRHADGYVTAYGYAQRARVREGQHVRGGQTLAEIGPASGGPSRLLFQVRRGAQAVDPAPLLGAP